MKKIYPNIILLLILLFFTPSFAFGQMLSGENISPFENKGKISLDLKGMDIVEVLKMLAAKGNLNIVVGNNVRGKVTMFLKDVNIEDAFDLILVANNLAMDERNGIIYVMTERDYEELYGTGYADKKEVKIIQLKYAKAVEVSKALNQIKSKVGRVITDETSNTIVIIDSREIILQANELLGKIDKPTRSEIFELSYAKAKDLKEKIQEMPTKDMGTMQIDERTNKIVITDTEENLEKIGNVIRAFDEKLQQVLIEAKIIEITLSDRYKLGIDWHAITKEFQDIINKEIGIRSSFKLASQGQLVPGAEIFVGAFGTGDYAAMVQALKTVGDTNILSSPRITTLNNEEAKILVGSNEPYATNTVTQGTSTTTTATSLTFMDIGVKLYVTPSINKDGFITVKIKPEVSSKSGEYTYGSPSTTVPIVSTTEAETSVMVKDGNTIIIAGLIKDERSGSESKIPLLGDIPLVGAVFKKTDNAVTKKELVIFITPHIISGESDLLEQPMSPPIGERKFTMPEAPTFYKRKGVSMSPTYFKDGVKKKIEKGEIDIETATPEDYFYVIRNAIMKNMYVPEEADISRGDRVKVSFGLYSNGQLISEPEVIESTSTSFNEVVIDAIKDIAPFPVFPISIRESKRRFVLEIIYNPDVSREGRPL